MKNLKKSVLCMLMAVIMVMTVTAASVIPVQDVYAASVKLNKTSLNMYTRTMIQLTVLNTGAKAKWSSSKPKVAIHCGCVELNAPCMYNNGPCCCTADLDIGDCPFRQGRLRLDDKFVDKQMAKLHTDRDIVKAEENIRRARVLIKQMEEELNSSTR